ncbi:ABC transporter ATP-binding protein [Roseateles cellulosilyticus]|uniref:ABC transporter ATP-binding protein/permease n=1 Tax=Pelomonas cellulosilytica TaxID=2906762 RepID=A0ABS8Y4E7_9BURK|nr:ABC transporter ATP-binding protein [Pelomonas sp. P8]MCE4558021.1 ABC transporter ATP-binding protein/permease [Pelomonas sp. P8]
MPNLGSFWPALRLVGQSLDRAAYNYIVGTLVLVTLGGALAAGSPLALKNMVDAISADTVVGSTTGERALVPGMIYLAMLAGGRLVSDLRPLLSSRIEQRVLASIRQCFFAHLHRLPIGNLISRRNGELLHGIDLAGAGAQAIVTYMTNTIAPVLIELALMAVILAGLDQPALAALFIATSALYLAVFAVGVVRQRPILQEVSSASLEVYGQLSDGITHVETLRCFDAAAHAEDSLKECSLRLMLQWHRLSRISVQSAVAVSAVVAVALASCLWISADAVAHGQMTPGGFVLASVYMLQMVRPLELLGAAARECLRAVGFMRPLLDILAEPTEADRPPPNGWTPPTTAPAVRIENLCFGYDPERPVIRGLNLDIAAGRTTAIVGSSGSGKSSLVRLLLRLYAPQAGRILVDGHSIDTLPAETARRLFGLVPQEAALLHASVRSNIALGRPEASSQDIERAADHAQIRQQIEALPRGYDTRLGERGQTLSGGERQRLAIARAVLRAPKIYLLDEPTSMLDAKTEAAVLRALRKLTAGCTTIVIAHRLSTVMHADEIVVLDDGQVRERGRHAELLASGGLYSQLWRQQTDGSA